MTWSKNHKSQDSAAPFGLKPPPKVPHTPRKRLLALITTPLAVQAFILLGFLCIFGNLYRNRPFNEMENPPEKERKVEEERFLSVNGKLYENKKSKIIEKDDKMKSSLSLSPSSGTIVQNLEQKQQVEEKPQPKPLINAEVTKSKEIDAEDSKIQETCFTLSSTMSLKVGGGYLFPPPNENEFLNAIGDTDKPLIERCFYMHSASDYMVDQGGSVNMNEYGVETDKLPVFIGKMPFTTEKVPLTHKINQNHLLYMDTKKEKWVFKLQDMKSHSLSLDNVFILEKQRENGDSNGEILYAIRHYSSGAYINIIDANGLTVRGHGNKPYKLEKSVKTRKEDSLSTMFKLSFRSKDEVEADSEAKKTAILDENVGEALLIEKIKEFENIHNETRVISYGLYGSNPKYTNGAIRNAELRDTYFPGWEIWYYYDAQVPRQVLDKLKSFPGVRLIACGKNDGIMGMFWRFQVADDARVDRYIVRDVDSRLNSRERMAVEEWINSEYPLHLLRDHVNHCHPFNGGMWGGVKGAFDDIGGLQNQMKKIAGKKTQYMGDMNFLNEGIYPMIKSKALSHDAYCCGKFENSRPFPTKRPSNYQHVGQVFNAEDQPRMSDINGFIRGKVVPPQCRRREDWVYG